MKRRFITKYELIHPDYDNRHVWGTCEKWVKELQMLGYKIITRHKILWVGQVPNCPACANGGHWRF